MRTSYDGKYYLYQTYFYLGNLGLEECLMTKILVHFIQEYLRWTL